GDAPIDTSQVRPGDLACFIYTAGTTGPSKGCMLPQNYIVSLAEQVERAWERRRDDIVLTPLPLFHFNAISIAVVGTVVAGGSAGAAGKPNLHDFDVRIVDDDDVPVATGEAGEIVCRPNGPNLMFAGYWNRPDATVEATRNLWFHTGDLGRVDDDGYLFFVDRKKD